MSRARAAITRHHKMPLDAVLWQTRRGRTSSNGSNPLLVGVDEIDEAFDVVALRQSRLFFAHPESGLHFGVAGPRIIKHELGVSAFVRVALLYVLQDPVRNLTVRDRAADDFDEPLVREAGGLQPPFIKSFAEVRLIIGMKFAGEMKTDFINIPRQMHPAAHRFARTARINEVGHGSLHRYIVTSLHRYIVTS